MQNTKITPTSNLRDSFYSEFKLFKEKWSKPEGSEITRITLLCVSLLSLANTVTQVFFTLVSLIPGSDSQWVKERIDVDGLARGGFESSKSEKERSFTAQLILPTLFKVIALTLNPYAIVKQPTSANLNKITCYSELLFKQANEFAKEGMSNKELCESTGDLSLEMEEFRVDEDYNGNFSDDYDDIVLKHDDSRKISANEKEIQKAEETRGPWKQWAIKEIGTRALYLAATLAILVEKTIYLAFGILFAVNALCLGFKYPQINQLAMEYLGTLDVIDDVCTGVRATFFPSEFILDQHQKYMDTPKK